MAKKVYLAGPMSGLPDNNYPAFNAEAARLRAMGYLVENPAENTPPECNSWEGWMRLSIRQMLTCDIVALLSGWSYSRGARIEYNLAQELDIECRIVSNVS